MVGMGPIGRPGDLGMLSGQQILAGTGNCWHCAEGAGDCCEQGLIRDLKSVRGQPGVAW